MRESGRERERERPSRIGVEWFTALIISSLPQSAGRKSIAIRGGKGCTTSARGREKAGRLIIRGEVQGDSKARYANYSKANAAIDAILSTRCIVKRCPELWSWKCCCTVVEGDKFVKIFLFLFALSRVGAALNLIKRFACIIDSVEVRVLFLKACRVVDQRIIFFFFFMLKFKNAKKRPIFIRQIWLRYFTSCVISTLLDFTILISKSLD